MTMTTRQQIVSPLWAASLNKGEATMNASETQTYAKAVRDLAVPEVAAG